MTTKTPIGIVCGSGIDLESLLDTRTQTIPFSALPNMAETSVTGHRGHYIHGTCGDIPIILQCGRLHLYEGHSYETVTRPVEELHAMGVQTILFTNAAGGLKPDMQPGDLLAANALTLWPSVRWKDPPNTITPDFVLEGCDHVGTYTWIHGPCYETQAEIHALQSSHSHAVGMSTAPEIAQSQSLNIRTASISCITNSCCSPQTLTHEHVIKIATDASQRICEIIRHAIVDIGPEAPSVKTPHQ